MIQNLESYARYYSSLTDEDLGRLSQDVQSLVPDARIALKAELERRQIPVEGINWTVHPAIPKVGNAIQTGLLRFSRNLLILAAFDFLFALLKNAQRPDAGGINFAILVESFTEGLLGALRPVYLILAALTAGHFSAKKAGLITQVCAILLVALMYFFDLESIGPRVVWLLMMAWMGYDWWRSENPSTPAV